MNSSVCKLPTLRNITVAKVHRLAGVINTSMSYIILVITGLKFLLHKGVFKDAFNLHDRPSTAAVFETGKVRCAALLLDDVVLIMNMCEG